MKFVIKIIANEIGPFVFSSQLQPSILDLETIVCVL